MERETAMRLLMVNSLYHPRVHSGAERSLQGLSESLARRGHEVHVASLTPDPEARTRSHQGVACHELRLRNLYWPCAARTHGAGLRAAWHAIDTLNPWMGPAFAALLRRVRPDLVHTHNLGGWSVGVWRAARRAGLPVLHTLRDYYLTCPRTTMFRAGGNCGSICTSCGIYGLPRKRTSRLVQGVVGISRHILERHLAGGFFSETPLRAVVHNSVEGPPFLPPRSTAATDPPRVGYLGRLESHKGLDLLLEAAARFGHDELEVWIAGGGDVARETALRDLAERPGGARIRYEGPVAIGEFLPALDGLVVPSLWEEPLNRTVLEAYAYGVPVIASRRGGIPEIVAHGHTGLLFDPDRAGALEVALREFLDRRADGAHWREAALAMAARFRPEAIAGQYEALYEQL